MHSPVFSIITPTFKRPELLCRNIQSLINQTFKDYEQIIVDDDEGDDALNAVSEFNDPRIKFWKNERLKGPAGAYNTGILKSRGQFLLFLDDDDEYYPGFLYRMHEAFSVSKKNVGFIWTGILVVRNTVSGQNYSEVVWPERIVSTEKGIAAATSIGNGYGLCVTREVQDIVGLYDENLKMGSDTDYLFRLVMNSAYSVLPEVLVKIYCDNENQLTADINNFERIKVKEIILKRYDKFLRKHPMTYGLQYFGYANLCYKQGLYRKGRKAIFSAIIFQPFRIRNYIDFLSYEICGKNFGSTSMGKSIKSLLN